MHALWQITPKYQLRLTLVNMLRHDQVNESSYFDQIGNLRKVNVFQSSMHVRLKLAMKF